MNLTQSLCQDVVGCDAGRQLGQPLHLVDEQHDRLVVACADRRAAPARGWRLCFCVGIERRARLVVKRRPELRRRVDVLRARGASVRSVASVDSYGTSSVLLALEYHFSCTRPAPALHRDEQRTQYPTSGKLVTSLTAKPPASAKPISRCGM